MRQRYVQPLRMAIQWSFVFFCLLIGFRFYQFVEHYRSGGLLSPVTRPAGVEAFLPISGLLGLKDWIINGSINRVHPAAVVIEDIDEVVEGSLFEPFRHQDAGKRNDVDGIEFGGGLEIRVNGNQRARPAPLQEHEDGD
jgi:hypothetical protein